MSPSLNEIMNLRMHASVKEYPSNQAANNKIPGPETEDFLVVGPVGLEPTTHGLKVRFSKFLNPFCHLGSLINPYKYGLFSALFVTSNLRSSKQNADYLRTVSRLGILMVSGSALAQIYVGRIITCIVGT